MASSDVNITGVNAKVIRGLADAISERMGEYTKELADIAKTSRGPGGLGVSNTAAEAQANAQRNIRGFSGGGLQSLGDLRSSIAGAFRTPTQSELAKMQRGEGAGFSTHAEAMARQREAMGLPPGGYGMVDPTLYGGKLSPGAMLRMGAQFFNNRAGDQLTPSSMRALNAASALQQASYHAPLVEHQIMPQLKQAYRYSQGLTALGSMQGTSAAGGDITIPGTNVGFRFPINAASIRGAMTKVDQLKQSMSAGINYGQAGDINAALLAQGYNQGSPMSGRLRDMYTSIVRSNEALNNPLTYQMGEAATRFGGADAMERFNKTLKDLPAIADRAGYSLSRMQSSMGGFVQSDIHQGGTVEKSMQTFNSQLSATGIDPSNLKALEKNPYIQASLMRGGIQPWEIGTANAKQRTMAEYGGVQNLYNTFGGKNIKPGSPEGQRIIAKVQQFGQIPLDTRTIEKMVNTDPENLSSLSDSMNLIDKYGKVGRKSGNQLADLGQFEKRAKLSEIETKAGMSYDERKKLEKELYGGKDISKDWAGDWEKKIRKAVTDKGRALGMEGVDERFGGKGGSKDAAGYVKQAADALNSAAGMMGSSKDAANAGALPSNYPYSDYGKGK